MEFGVGVGEWWVRGQESGVSSWSSELELGLELELAAERRPGRGDVACSPRTPRGESFGCKHFSKKFVIDCHWAHTFTWLNLLLEPKRHLQRFGFVFLGDASFCGFSHKGLVGVRSSELELELESGVGGGAKVRAKGCGVFAEGP